MYIVNFMQEIIKAQAQQMGLKGQMQTDVVLILQESQY